MTKQSNDLSLTRRCSDDFPPKAVQTCLFFMPYTFILVTAITLLVAQSPFGWWVGLSNLSLLIGYFLNLLGNHYLKIFSFALNIAGFILLVVTKDLYGVILLVTCYWLPAITFVVISLLFPSISEIIPNELYLSNACAAKSLYWPQLHNITHVLDLTAKGHHKVASLSYQKKQNQQQNQTTNIKIKLLRVNDSLGSQGSLAAVIDQAMDFCEEATANGGVVLLHCYAGQSRSAAFAIYYLMQQKKMTLAEAYRFVRNKRPVVDVSSDHMAPLQLLDHRIKTR